MKVLILGSTGMLGSMVSKHFSTKDDMEIMTPTREQLGEIRYSNYDYIINCIGITSHKLDDPKEAIIINSLFPYTLSEEAKDTKVIQIATDCVYSGKKGGYMEDDKHDALDIYGKTKSLGEVDADNFYNIRTSIVGPEPNGKVSLLGWFLSQKKNAAINGYTNHRWNGVTTLQFAKLCYVIIKENLNIPHNFHFVPANVVSKYELLEIFSEKFDRGDIHLEQVSAPTKVDRTLSTVYPASNKQLWEEMGYSEPLEIKDMINEL